jgi:MFS family permease
MHAIIVRIWPLFFGISLILVVNGLQGPLLSTHAIKAGFGERLTGLVMSGYFVGFMLGSMFIPRMIQSVGHIRVFAALASLTSAAFICFPHWVNPTFWFTLRLVIGVGLAGIYIISESWLNSVAKNEERGAIFSAYIMVQTSGIIFGQFLFSLHDESNTFLMFSAASVLISLSFTPILLTKIAAPVVSLQKSMTIRQLLQISPLGVVGMFVTGSIFGGTNSMGAIYGSQEGFSNSQIGVFLGMLTLGGFVFQIPFSRITDRTNQRNIIVLLSVVGAVASWVVNYFHSYIAILVCVFIIGGASYTLYSVITTHVNNYLDKNSILAASSGLILVNGIGAILGPITIGIAMYHYDHKMYFYVLSFFFFLITLYSLYRTYKRPLVIAAEKSSRKLFRTRGVQNFNALMGPRTTPISAQIVLETQISNRKEDETAQSSQIYDSQERDILSESESDTDTDTDTEHQTSNEQ